MIRIPDLFTIPYVLFPHKGIQVYTLVYRVSDTNVPGPCGKPFEFKAKNRPPHESTFFYKEIATHVSSATNVVDINPTKDNYRSR